MSSFLSDIIASAGGEMKNAGREQIKYIDINDIRKDERNFYHMDSDSIADLAASIELIGLQQPVRVRPENGVYIISSGHRRFSAFWMLYEKDPENWRLLPCIEDEIDSSPAMQELRLIMANSATRKLSDSDIAKQAERTTELLYQLKEEGVEFPGSMRKHVAEACQISETKLATLKVINENLHEHFKAQFSAGELPTNTAYNIARLPALVQADLAKAMPKSKVSGNASDNLLKCYKKYYEQTFCEKGGNFCDNSRGKLSKTAHGTMSWDFCGGGCCLACGSNLSCAYACAHAKKAQKAEKEREAKRQARYEEERQRGYEENRRETIKSASRIAALADAAGLPDSVDSGVGDNWRKIDLGRIRAWARGETGDCTFHGDSAAYTNIGKLVAASRAFGCSTDALLGLAEPGEKPVAADCEWQTGKPAVDGLYIGRFYADGMEKPMLHPAIWRDGCWNFHNISASIDMECVGWHKIPEV